MVRVQIPVIGSNHPSRVNEEFLKDHKLKEIIQSRKLEYVSPLRAVPVRMVDC